MWTRSPGAKSNHIMRGNSQAKGHLHRYCCNCKFNEGTWSTGVWEPKIPTQDRKDRSRCFSALLRITRLFRVFVCWCARMLRWTVVVIHVQVEWRIPSLQQLLNYRFTPCSSIRQKIDPCARMSIVVSGTWVCIVQFLLAVHVSYYTCSCNGCLRIAF